MENKTMHVVHILSTFFEDSSTVGAMSSFGGAERFVFELAKAMSEKVNVKLIVFGKERKSLFDNNLCIEIYPAFNYLVSLNGKSNPISFKFLSEIDNSDIVHIHQLRSDVSLLSSIYSKIKGKKIFATDHGWNGACFGRFKIIEHLVDGFLPDCKFDEKFIKRYMKSIKPIYGGVDTKKFYSSENSKKNNRVLFVGRILPHKGINYLIESIEKNIELHIIGQTADEEYLEYLNSISIGKNVNFLLSPSDKDMVKEYQEAVVTVLPSVYTDVYGKYHPKPELLGLVLIEAIACGTPVICTNVGGMPEIITEDLTGFIIPPNDSKAIKEKIQYLIENPTVAKKMGKNGRRMVLEKFTWDKVTERCLEAYISQGSK